MLLMGIVKVEGLSTDIAEVLGCGSVLVAIVFTSGGADSARLVSDALHTSFLFLLFSAPS